MSIKNSIIVLAVLSILCWIFPTFAFWMNVLGWIMVVGFLLKICAMEKECNKGR